MSKKTIIPNFTRSELAALKPSEIDYLKNSLTQFIGTEEEPAARELYKLIKEILQ